MKEYKLNDEIKDVIHAISEFKKNNLNILAQSKERDYFKEIRLAITQEFLAYLEDNNLSIKVNRKEKSLDLYDYFYIKNGEFITSCNTLKNVLNGLDNLYSNNFDELYGRYDEGENIKGNDGNFLLCRFIQSEKVRDYLDTIDYSNFKETNQDILKKLPNEPDFNNLEGLLNIFGDTKSNLKDFLKSAGFDLNQEAQDLEESEE